MLRRFLKLVGTKNGKKSPSYFEYYEDSWRREKRRRTERKAKAVKERDQEAVSTKILGEEDKSMIPEPKEISWTFRSEQAANTERSSRKQQRGTDPRMKPSQ